MVKDSAVSARDHPVSQALRGTRDLPVHSSRRTATTGTWHRLTVHRGINLNVYKDARLQAFIDTCDWITTGLTLTT